MTFLEAVLGLLAAACLIYLDYEWRWKRRGPR
jgi:hypothetical protein